MADVESQVPEPSGPKGNKALASASKWHVRWASRARARSDRSSSGSPAILRRVLLDAGSRIELSVGPRLEPQALARTTPTVIATLLRLRITSGLPTLA